ncbi:MAG: hypothetical protein QW835_00595 [Candidatus Hadarchaeum sp.]
MAKIKLQETKDCNACPYWKDEKPVASRANSSPGGYGKCIREAGRAILKEPEGGKKKMGVPHIPQKSPSQLPSNGILEVNLESIYLSLTNLANFSMGSYRGTFGIKVPELLANYHPEQKTFFNRGD